VGVGGNAYRTLRRNVVPTMKRPPVLFQVTHYAAWRERESAWELEFPELVRLLDRLKPESDWTI
jgi:hypothetical protein